jgi:4-alpha-glucanotransferase
MLDPFNQRSSGILLHITSLPGSFGIGDMGPAAYQWIDFLAESGTGLWQVLPLGPTGYGDSPYQSFSTFGGNPFLISPDLLLEDGYIHKNDLQDLPAFSNSIVEYEKVIWWKIDLLNRAFSQIEILPNLENKLNRFNEDNRGWIHDYALFMAIKESQGTKPWIEWPAPLRDRDQAELERFESKNSYAVRKQIFFQYLFSQQWERLKKYAHQKGIQIIGDVPIYIAHDSADAWSHRELLQLDDSGKPTVLAGVPPDYFSDSGQLWGNPLYCWERHAENGYRWWSDRLGSVLSYVDIVRLDHFRGFAGYWEIPAGETTAEKGRWVPGPGADFLSRIKDDLGKLPFIAEDLGEITPDVLELRDRFNLPGMKVLVFAFDRGESNLFLPHHYTNHFVVYTGTHDNDTVVGWFNRIHGEEKEFAMKYLNTNGEDIAWDLVKAAWLSKAVFAIAPMQDILGLDNSARMNYPGNPQGNWSWRMLDDYWDEELIRRLLEINQATNRSVAAIKD